MKNYNQVYVKNSLEAAQLYCRAFGAGITRAFLNESQTAYEHCELSVNGEGFLALAEAKNPCDVAVVHQHRWETMTFNVFEMGTEEAVQQAFQVLSEGGAEQLLRHHHRPIRRVLVDFHLAEAWLDIPLFPCKTDAIKRRR